MRLIVGLGNPGKEYARNRHNIGFRCVDYLARHNRIQLKERRHHSRLGSGRIDDTEVLLVKPHTFVNRSGEAVGKLVRQYGIAAGDVIVISDDLDLSLGKLRVRAGGSSGGHKGLKSIASALGSTDFLRLRIGIGRPEDSPLDREAQIVDHVLGDFTPDEERQVALVIPRAAEAIQCLLSDGVSAAMSRFN